MSSSSYINHISVCRDSPQTKQLKRTKSPPRLPTPPPPRTPRIQYLTGNLTCIRLNRLLAISVTILTLLFVFTVLVVMAGMTATPDIKPLVFNFDCGNFSSEEFAFEQNEYEDYDENTEEEEARYKRQSEGEYEEYEEYEEYDEEGGDYSSGSGDYSAMGSEFGMVLEDDNVVRVPYCPPFDTRQKIEKMFTSITSTPQLFYKVFASSFGSLLTLMMPMRSIAIACDAFAHKRKRVVAILINLLALVSGAVFQVSMAFIMMDWVRIPLFAHAGVCGVLLLVQLAMIGLIV